MRKINAVGFAVTEGRFDGGWNLRCWTRFEDPASTEEHDYKRMLYCEMVDVILAHLDENRPGRTGASGWTQLTLGD